MSKTKDENHQSTKNIFKNSWWVPKLVFKEYPIATLFAVLGSVWRNSSGLVRATIIGMLVDWTIQYSQENDLETLLYKATLAFGGYILFNTVINNLTSHAKNITRTSIRMQLTHKLQLQKLSETSIAHVENPDFQDLNSRFNRYSYTIYVFFHGIIEIFGRFVAICVAFVPIYNLSPYVALAFFVTSVPLMHQNQLFVSRIWQLDFDLTEESRKAFGLKGYVTEPESLKEVKLTNSGKYIENSFYQYVKKYLNKLNNIYWKDTYYSIFSTILNIGAYTFGIYVITNQAFNEEISYGQIATYIGILSTFDSSLSSIMYYVSDLLGSNLKVNDIRKLLDFGNDDAQEDQEHKKEIGLVTEPPQITLKNVSFAYPKSETNIISNLDLTISPGEKIAIVGKNGAGKTTLVKLISRIYPITEGEILFNDLNIEEIKTKSLYKNIGSLYQDFNKYSPLTVKENITIGDRDGVIDEDKMIDAAKKADAYEFIKEYKNGFDQILSEKFEGGIRPSQGQWQKIAIARFFYRDAPLLIFDEPTAAIDPQAEAKIFNKIYEFINDKTVIIISHRFSTVRNADRIIVFDKGQILEQGTHKELLALGGEYAKAYKVQAEGYKDE